MSANPDPGPVMRWVLAARPKTLSAAAAPVAAGTGLAYADGRFAAGPAVAALVGALLIQIGTNFANDYYDYMKGGDTGDRLGPTRVTQAGLIPPESVKRGMWLVLSLAFLVGIYLVSVGGWPIVVIGLASLVCAVAYTGGPMPLAYNGLGDLFVFLFFGLVAVGGTYWVQALVLSPGALLAGSGLGAFATAILVVNNLRDRETDALAGKKTLAVRFGDHWTICEYVACIVVAAVALIAGVSVLGWSPYTLFGLIGISSLRPVWSRMLDYQNRRGLNPALGETARGVAIYGFGMALGHLFGGL